METCRLEERRFFTCGWLNFTGFYCILEERYMFCYLSSNGFGATVCTRLTMTPGRITGSCRMASLLSPFWRSKPSGGRGRRLFSIESSIPIGFQENLDCALTPDSTSQHDSQHVTINWHSMTGRMCVSDCLKGLIEIFVFYFVMS